MADALVAELLTLSTIAANTFGSSVEIGTLRRVAKVRYFVEVFEPDLVELSLETSADEVTWREVDRREAVEGADEFLAVDLSSFVRLSLVVPSGTTIKLRAEAEAHVIYCEPRDLVVFGMPEKAMEDVEMVDRFDLCLGASDEADGYLNSAYTLPLTAWGYDLRKHCARIANKDLLDQRGWDEGGPDKVIEKDHDKAIAWLSKIANGKLKPPGIKDSTPETFEGGSVVLSRTKRGW